MADDESKTEASPAAMLTLEELQHWTWIMGRAQQLMLEHVAAGMSGAEAFAASAKPAIAWPGMELFADPAKLAKAQSDLWTEGLGIWQRALGAYGGRAELD